MFPQHGASRPNGHVHVEFKAGRMEWDGRMVTPDKRKGKVVLFTSEEDQLTHFQWHDRDKNEMVLDLIVINDAYLEKIEKCTTGRVYLLRYTSSDKKLFFWMQEPKEDGDSKLIKKFNEAIGAKIPEKGAKPEGAAATGAGAAGGAGLAPASAQDLDPQLQAILQQFQSLAGQQAGGTRAASVPLGAVLTTEVLQGLLSDEAAAAEMMSLLPDTHKTPDGLREALASPQLQQNLNGLTQAIHSDQLPVLLAGLGLDPGAITAAPGSDALEVLCQAMEAQSGGSSSGGGGNTTESTGEADGTSGSTS